ncbi:MAG: putative methyl-accepting chemotaxis protein [Chlamydiales bacterium]|jgi:hypothetical protein|nr:putative methyl-accepting chemotaxis protein [Chlamydiales bacterium]
MGQNEMSNLCTKFGINQESLAKRKEFLRITEETQKALLPLIPWIEKQAAPIAKEYYDWMFNFSLTRSIFENIASAKNIPITQLRENLEAKKREYIKQVFQGARENWGLAYFETRLETGVEYGKMNFPMKWFLGAYVELLAILSRYLKEEIKDSKEHRNVMRALYNVTNYDLQGVFDAFILMTLESVGLSLDSIQETRDTDKTEYLFVLKENIHTLQAQAQAIADGHLDSAVLNTKIKGALGESFMKMIDRLKTVMAQIFESSQALAKAAGELNSSNNELTKSIQDIAKSASEAASLASESASKAKETSVFVNKLGSSSADIGGVIRVIKSITDQTKVLALNATIEASRAGGEAGKGFAVVAHEVKELSKATAQAAGDIEVKIGAIQTDTKTTIDGISSINQSIDEISNTSEAISHAVEEQKVTTNMTLTAFKELSKMAEELQNIVKQFRVSA